MIEIAGKYTSVTRGINGSSQPRFNNLQPASFNSLYRFYVDDIYKEPIYSQKSRDRDEWLRRIWRKEPYLSGVINSVVQIDKNRGWTLTGGRNQVNRFKRIFHNEFYLAPDLSGWRSTLSGLAQAFYTSDLGAVGEVKRDTQDGPMTGLYFTDPAHCQLTGDSEHPLKYYPTSGKMQRWTNNDYFRIVSMPSTDETMAGLGYCALSRCIELTKIMIGIYQYDNEMLLNQAPRGLLLLKGITEEQWEDTMTARTAKLEGDEQKYYGAVHVLATLDPGVEIEAQLTALSQLPAEFDQETFTNLLMFGYALVFGYDPREFWPVSQGLGTAAESEVMHRKSGGKGALDFAFGFQEKLQGRLPDTILFMFDERDRDGELQEALLQQEQVKYITDMYTAGLRETSNGVISREEARSLLAQQGLIPDDWTIQEEDVTVDDEGDKQRLLQQDNVQRAIYELQDENIISYQFPTNRTITLAKASRTRRNSFVVNRQQEQVDLYQAQLEELSNLAVEGDITQSEFDRRLKTLTQAILIYALLKDTSEEAIKQAALTAITSDDLEAQLEANSILSDNELIAAAMTPAMYAKYIDELALSELSTLGEDIYSGSYDDDRASLLSRLGMWGSTALGLYQYGRVVNAPQVYYQWRVGPTDHCNDCARLDGQIHTGDEWDASGWYPQSRGLSCNGYRCQCSLIRVSATESVGNF